MLLFLLKKMPTQSRFSTIRGAPYTPRPGDRILWDKRNHVITVRPEGSSAAVLVDGKMTVSTKGITGTAAMKLIEELAKASGNGVRFAQEEYLTEIYELRSSP